MTKIYKHPRGGAIFVGDDEDYSSVKDVAHGVFLHCAKHPYHCKMVGYSGNLKPNHTNYACIRKENRMALNLVDMDTFDEKYLPHYKTMLSKAFHFLDDHVLNWRSVLINCNQGVSRGPTIGMMYVARLGAWGFVDFKETVERFRNIYPKYEPSLSMSSIAENLWNEFVWRVS